MVEYIYFVKCPNCEDEHFDFFDEAKAYALGCLSKKPIITQVEVCRNDFGECTDSYDLGTKWSWEDMMGNEVDGEPISENALRAGGFRTDGYRTALACYDSDDFDINVEFGMQDEEEYEAEDQLYLLCPGQTVADLVVYLSRECGFTSVYVYGETSANRAEIKTATRFTTVPGNHDYRHYGTIEDRLVEECANKARKSIPAGTVFSKAETFGISEGLDDFDDFDIGPQIDEFDNLDNSIDFELEISEVSDKNKLSEWKTIPSAISREALWDRLIDLIDGNSAIEEVIADELAPLGGYPDGKYFGDWDDSSFPEDVLSTEALKDFVDKAVAKYSMNESVDSKLKTWICYYDNIDVGTVEASNRDEALEKFADEYRDRYIFDHWDHDWDVEETVEEACERKPIPEGMTVEQLVEEMEENEDTVECALCQDLFDKSTCRKELNLGWCCPRCADDLTARGEGPVFKEDNYWDFLDEDAEPHDLGNEYDGGYPTIQTWVCYFDGVDIGTVEAATEDEALEKMQQEYPEYPYGLRHEVDIWVEPADDGTFDLAFPEVKN